jgi:neopullulanase
MRCRAVNPEAYLVGEIWEEAPAWLAGDRFDAVMNYPLATAILAYAAGGRMDQGALAFHHAYRDLRPLDGAGLSHELDRILDLYDPAVTAVQLNLLGSHDTPRFLSLSGGDRAALRIATILQMTLPGAPCIYYGDEVGLEGGADPANRGAFPWDLSRWDTDLLDFVRSAVRLRRSSRALVHGTTSFVAAAGGAMAFLRSFEREHALVALNTDEEPRRLALAMPGAGSALASVALPGWPTPPGSAGTLAGVEAGDAIELGAGDKLELEVPGRAGLVFRSIGPS